MNKVVIKYVGNGLFKDAKGVMWDRDNNAIENRTTRDYDGTEEEFRKERPDLAFMVDYGQMQMHLISDNEVKAEVKTPVIPPVEPPVTEEVKTEVVPPVTEEVKSEPAKATGTKVTVNANK